VCGTATKPHAKQRRRQPPNQPTYRSFTEVGAVWALVIAATHRSAEPSRSVSIIVRAVPSSPLCVSEKVRSSLASALRLSSKGMTPLMAAFTFFTVGSR